MKTKLFLVVAAVALAFTAGATHSPTVAAPQRQTTIVSSTADSGPGTLREALEQATAGTTIIFNPTLFPPEDPATIFILTALPELAQGRVTIDASDAGVILDGSQAPRTQPVPGFMVTSTGNVIRGLQILHFSSGGIILERGARDNIVGGDRTKGAGPTGQGNVISGNEVGVGINGVGTRANVVSGNYIGIDVSGSSAMPNIRGVVITGATDNILGGTNEGQGNVISGNEMDGVVIAGSDTTGNRVIGNHIGISASGAQPIGNGAAGVWLGEGTQQNTIGGSNSGERNVISGNGNNGVAIDGGAYNTVSGNYIGTDSSGTAPIPNGNFGVAIGGSAQGNQIGGPTAAEGNVISGNGGGGVECLGSGVRDNTIRGNLIGLDVHGNQALPN
ncbi:MAG TPA: hypothetical protein ENO24_00660, partial [Chloroflexi bacterium]|nr:hypothetical protein [Chloroflexota bacterium]